MMIIVKNALARLNPVFLAPQDTGLMEINAILSALRGNFINIQYAMTVV